MTVQMEEVESLTHKDKNGTVRINEEDEDVEAKANYKCYHVNTNILPAKLSYFFECARRMGYTPNLILFLSSIGLTKTEAGFIVGFRLIGQMLGGPFWGMISDKWHCHRTVIFVMSLASLLTMCSQPFISLQYGNPLLNKCPEPILSSNTFSNFSSTANYSQSIYNTTTEKKYEVQSVAVEKGKQFGMLFFMMYFINFAVSFSEGSAVAFVDTATIRKAQLSTRREIQYGRQRMFAALGGAFGVTLTNLAIEYFPTANVTCYTGLVSAYSVFTLFFAAILIYMYRGISFKTTQKNVEDEDATEKNNQFRKILFATLKRKEVMFFYLTAFVSGLEYSQHGSFTFLYLKEMGAASYILSLSIVASNAGSLFGFVFAQRIMEVLGGYWKASILCFSAYCIRYFGTALATSPWIVVCLQTSHCVTATLVVASGVTHLKETSPLPIITTMVSMFNSFHYGVGTIVGTSLGGIVYEKYGGKALYMCTASLAAVWTVVLILFVCCLQSRIDKHSDVEESKEEKTNLTTDL